MLIMDGKLRLALKSSALIALLVLLVPFSLTLLNGQSTWRGGHGGGWDWTLFDFIVMGGLIFAASLLVHFINHLLPTFWLRLPLIALVILLLIVIWIELAVGILP